jgi:DNA end-binding protein Ku
MWKGVIRCGEIELPVRLFAAIEDQDVHFHLLHDQDMVRVKQRMVNSTTDETVEPSAIRKGAATDDGGFVMLTDEDLESLAPEPAREVTITRFVEPKVVSEQWFVRPYYLGPDDGADAEYFALCQELAKQGREGVAHWVMRGKQYHGVLRCENGYLMLVTLRSADEIIPPEELPTPQGRPLDRKELQMAEQLVGALEDEFRPEEYKDEYRTRVRELVESKAKGRKIKLEKPKAPPKQAAESLAGVLAASLKVVQKERSRGR